MADSIFDEIQLKWIDMEKENIYVLDKNGNPKYKLIAKTEMFVRIRDCKTGEILEGFKDFYKGKTTIRIGRKRINYSDFTRCYGRKD